MAARRGLRARLRSPTALWGRFYAGRGPPRGATWADLVRGRTVADLARGLEHGGSGQGDLRLASWNVRWLVSPHSDKGKLKKAVITRHLLQGRIVAIQETHWDSRDEAVWQGMFPGTDVVSSPARLGPRGGPQGGIALLAPRPYELMAQREVLAGCSV